MHWLHLFMEANLKELIAILLYKLGIEPSISTFIDEVTITFGYGELDWAGGWEYEVPPKHLTKKDKEMAKELSSYRSRTVTYEA